MMEAGGENKTNANMGPDPYPNIIEHELHHTFPLTEQEHGGPNINNKLETHSSSSSSSSSPSSPLSSQNPFLVPSDATNNIVYEGSSIADETYHSPSNDVQGFPPSFAPSAAYETSSRGNPFHEPINTNNRVPHEALEPLQNQPPPACENVPTNVDSQHPLQVTDQGQQSIMASNNLEKSISPASESSSQEHTHEFVNDINKPQTDTKSPPKLGLDSQVAEESSDDDIPISSMDGPSSERKHGHSNDVAGQQYIGGAAASHGSNGEIGTKKGSEIQTPPVQVMERPGESSQYVFPSHVFARNNTNAPGEWSTASNESLFSIYMGNMSFSNELVCLKSCELDKPGGDNNTNTHNDPQNASPAQPPAPVNKFNDISQRTAEMHEETSRLTEAKAAETMREVIMESSRTTENTSKKVERNSNSRNQSDGSTKSYAFKTSTEGDKSVSSNSGRDKQKQQKQSEQKETPIADEQTPKSTTNAPANRFLQCFACCACCH